MVHWSRQMQRSPVSCLPAPMHSTLRESTISLAAGRCWNFDRACARCKTHWLACLAHIVTTSVFEVVRYQIIPDHSETQERPRQDKYSACCSMVAITVIAVVMLWAFYGFRYAARPTGLQLNPPLSAYVQGLKPHEIWLVSTMARFACFAGIISLRTCRCAVNRKLLHRATC